MTPATIPTDENLRLAELYRYEILDTPYEEDFNEIVQLASQTCQTPIATISFIDNSRLWCKAAVGLTEPSKNRDTAFCAHTILNDGLLEVHDSLLDERFFDNPLVTGYPNIRFYAGVPLVTSRGFKLGALCVIDIVPRLLSAEQSFALRMLAKQTVKLIELRLLNKEAAYSLEVQKKMIGILGQDVHDPLFSLKSLLELYTSKKFAQHNTDEMLAILNINASRTLQTINNLVEWSKIQFHLTQKPTERINVHELVSECIEQAELHIMLKRNTVINTVSANIYINADKQGLLFILRNLLTNANRFTDNGLITIFEFKRNGRIYLCVEDTGAGIEMSKINVMLEEPGKFSSIETENRHGSGLSLIKNYIIKTGNELEIKSILGEGTAISFSLMPA